MGAAKKLELTPDQQYIQDALKAGRCERTDVSMKALTADTSFQARVQHLDMNHVHKLDQIRRDTGSLARIVVFTDAARSVFLLADGFHRHEVYRRAKEQAVPAYLIEADEPRREALLFATMCNRELCLPRSKKDTRKAVEMLFADPECWNWANLRIAKHCGVHLATVSRYRAEYASQHGLEIPVMRFCSNGRMVGPTQLMPFESQIKDIPEIKTVMSKGKLKYYCWFNGSSIHLGSTMHQAEAKLKKLLEDWERLNHSKQSSRAKSSRYAVTYRLRALGISEESTGFCVGGCSICAGLRYANIIAVFESDPTAKRLMLAAMQLRLYRAFNDVSEARLICVCDPPKNLNAFVDLIRKDGIEFLTGDELIAEILIARNAQTDSENVL